MSNRPASRSPSGVNDTPPNPSHELYESHEYEDATETKLDHSKPPHHDKTAADRKHADEPTISVGKP